jgi:PhzF family phenazine biosynthesis protein
MKRRFIQCDVFSDQPLKGNGLAVVLDGEGLSVAQMQAFAQWTQQAETTFLLPPSDKRADYKVRIFSATREMPFAGHPTLGSAAAWLHAGGLPQQKSRVVQDCAIGLVEIDLSGSAPAFVAPPSQISEMAKAEKARICAALGIDPSDVLASVTLDNGAERQLLELKTAVAVLALDANAVSLPVFQGVSVIGRHPDGAEAAYEVRNLTPASLMPEDAVTGSLIAAVGVWLAQTGRLQSDLIIAQGTAMGCAGCAFVSRRGADVMIGGHVCMVIEGEVDI